MKQQFFGHNLKFENVVYFRKAVLSPSLINQLKFMDTNVASAP